MDDREFLGKRRDRAIATILGYKEKECDRYLPQEISVGLRKIILDHMNDLCDLALDLMDDDIDYNQEFLDRFEQLLTKR